MNKKKKIIILSVLLILIVIFIIIHEVFYNHITTKLFDNLKLMNASSTIIALSTSKIWSDAINNEVSDVSEKYFETYELYGRTRYKYDFNVGIHNFYQDNRTQSILELINDTATNCSKYYNMYSYTLFHNKRNKLIEDFYDASLRLKKIAESPSGNYTTFNNTLSEQLDVISIIREKLDIK